MNKLKKIPIVKSFMKCSSAEKRECSKEWGQDCKNCPYVKIKSEEKIEIVNCKTLYR